MDAVAGQNVAHSLDKIGLRHRELGGAAFAPFLVGGDGGGRAGAFDQVLDLHFPALMLIAPLDDDAGRVAPVGILELGPHFPAGNRRCAPCPTR